MAFHKNTIDSRLTAVANEVTNIGIISPQKLIDTFLEKVIVYKDRIEIKFNIESSPDKPPKTRKDKNNPNGSFDFFVTYN